MKVLAYIPLHYGKEYLREAIKSIENHVEKIIILYAEKPSYGFGTNIVCPDTKEELWQIALSASGKVEWMDVQPGTEGEHRNIIYKYSEGYDLVLSTDADEIWDNDSLAECLKEAYRGTERYYGIDGFINFWRSFNEVCLDHFHPVRITNLKNNSGVGSVKCKVYHFSTCQNEAIMRYKYEIHGHKSEIKKNWLSDIYFANIKTDNHPVSIALWNCQPFDKETLPEILKQHPNYNKELI